MQYKTRTLMNEEQKEAKYSPVIFKCKACRHDQFSSDILVTHTPAKRGFPGSKLNDQRANPAPSRTVGISVVQETDPNATLPRSCSSYHISEEADFLKPVLGKGELAGKLFCSNTKCMAKLGSYDWAGETCSCGQWINPSFSIQVGRVDVVKS